jgi:hypothetical protein
MTSKNTPLTMGKNLDASKRFDKFTLDDFVSSRGENFARAGTPPEESQKSENFVWLEQGDHKGITIVKKNTVLVGQPGAKFTAPVIVMSGGYAIFTNCYFEQTKDTAETLVTINQGGRAIFQNCVFKRFPKGDTERLGQVSNTSCYIALNTTINGETLGSATGCIWFEESDSNAVSVIDNKGSGNGNFFIGQSLNATTKVFGVAGTTGNLTL